MRLDSKYVLVLKYMETLQTMRKTINIVSDWTINNLLKGNATTYDMADKISKHIGIPLTSMFARVESDKKLSNTTISDYHRLISTILATAVHWQHIQANPCERVKPPKIEHKDAGHYDDNVAKKMFELLEAAPLKYQSAIYIAIFGGLRLGEVAALEWTDIDFKQNTINISKAAQYISGIGSFDKSPKTERGYREIALPMLAMDKINNHRLEQIEYRLKMDNLWDHHNKVFMQENGKPIFHDTLSKWFNKWLKANNLPKLKFHELRHTNASLLIAQGVDIATVSKRLVQTYSNTCTEK